MFDVTVIIVVIRQNRDIVGQHVAIQYAAISDKGKDPFFFGGDQIFKLALGKIFVSFKQYFFAGNNVLTDHMHDRDLFLFTLVDQGIDFIFEIFQGFGDNGTQHRHGTCTVSRRSYRPEFKFISCECKWRSTVTIRVIH